MELVSTMEISGEEREIADAYAREQCATNAQNIAKNAEGIAGLNSNLDTLEYSDIAGGKNLFKEYIDMNEYSISNEKYNGYPVIYKKGSWNGAKANTILKAGKTYAVTVYSKGTGQIALYGSTSFTAPARTITSDWIRYGWVISVTSDTNELRVENVSDSGETYIACMQIEEGTTETPYEPYIPSVKMLAEEVDNVNDSLSVIGKCKNLLKPTLQTTTVNGITCTDNGDGTYTLNGTATEKAEFSLFDNLKKYQHLKNRTVKLVGCPKGGSLTTYRMYLQLQKSPWTSAIDSGEGSSVTVDNNDNWSCWIRIYKDATVSNLVFKPMITTDLSATYDDFVPYTGDGDTLTADVAELKNDLSDCCKKSDITTNETLIGTFNGKNYYRKLFTGIGASGSSVTVNVGEKIEIYNYYGRAYTYGQSGASDVKYPIPNKNYYIDSQNASETSFQLTIPTSSDMRKIDLVIEYTKVDE